MTTRQVIAKVKLDDISIHYCKQCGKDMGYEWLLNKVCGECCHKNHKKVSGH